MYNMGRKVEQKQPQKENLERIIIRKSVEGLVKTKHKYTQKITIEGKTSTRT